MYLFLIHTPTLTYPTQKPNLSSSLNRLMDPDATKEYNRVSVTFPVSIERCERVSVREPSWRILVMGPTGAGKSTFVESLGCKGSSSLQISSNKLDGFTQSISTYLVKNVTSNRVPIYLVDSPGFADAKISEFEIVAMLKKWIEENGGMYFHRILYLTPITCVRLAGSQKRVLSTFQALTGTNTAENITIVTTMWDSLWGENSMRRADATFKQLRNEVWQVKRTTGYGEGVLMSLIQDFLNLKQSDHIVKFHNTQHSALTILDGALGAGVSDYFQLENMVKNSQDVRMTPFATNLYNDLQHRIQSLRLHKENILLEQEQTATQVDPLLDTFLLSQLGGVEKDLTKFEQELREFGPLPNLPDAVRVSSDQSFINVVEVEHTLKHPIPDPVGALAPSVVISTSTSKTAASVPSLLNCPPGGHVHGLGTHLDERWQEGGFTRAVRSLQCWVTHWFKGNG